MMQKDVELIYSGRNQKVDKKNLIMYIYYYANYWLNKQYKHIFEYIKEGIEIILPV